MKRTNTMIKALLGGGALLLVFAFVGQAAADGLTLDSATFFGGASDQRGTGIAIGGGSIRLSGETAAHGGDALIVSYGTPPGAPDWSDVWPEVNGPDTFVSIATSSAEIYTVGYSDSQTSDDVGGKEVKGIVAKYPFGGTVPTWVATPNFFAYRGTESFSGVTTAIEGGSTFIYAVGAGEPCSFGKFIIGKFDSSGTLVAKATEPGNEPNFTTFCSVFQTGFSGGMAVTVHGGSVYVGGVSTLTASGEDAVGRPVLMKYDPALNRIWKQRPSDIQGSIRGVTAFGGAIYGVGQTFGATPDASDYLILKYDEAGNEIWREIFGGPLEDGLTGAAEIGGRLFVVGYTKSAGGGGKDIVVMEIDPATGNTLSTTLFGGAQDDMANGVATDGTDLYVVGESRSFASADGNVAGQNDLVLLRYTFEPSELLVDIDIKPGSFPNSINPRSRGVIPVAILTTEAFDATTVDPNSVEFGPSGAMPVHFALEDVDGDLDLDMILHFRTQDTGIVCGDTSASLTGKTIGGQMIEGADSFKTAGCK